MPIICNIILSNVRRSDESIFRGVLPSLSSATNLDWRIISEGAADVVITDADTSQGRLSAERAESLGVHTIRIASKVDSDQQQLWLKKPIRPAEVLRLLGELKLTQFAMLHKWPGKDVIRSCLGSSRLCAVFFRRNVSIEAACETSRLPRDQVLLFIDKCIDTHCMKISNSECEPNPNNTKNTSLFSRLRRKLYSRG